MKTPPSRRPMLDPRERMLAAAVATVVSSSLAAQVQFDRLDASSFGPSGAPTDHFVVATGDVDGDGDLDILWARTTQLRLDINDGRGRFTDRTSTSIPNLTTVGNVRGAALGDVDGDGDLDLVVGRAGPGSRAAARAPDELLLNDGQGVFQRAPASRFPSTSLNTTGVAFGDLDGDGDLDVLTTSLGFSYTYCNYNYGIPPLCTQRQSREQNQVLINDGAGHFTNESAARWPQGSDYTISFALGDLDQDGDLDAVTVTQAPNPTPFFFGGDIQLWINDGAGFLSNANMGRLPLNTGSATGVGLADLDSDGDLDIFGVNGAFPIRPVDDVLLRNDGTGVFTSDASALPPGARANASLQLADLDGDGHVDILVASQSTPLRLYSNDGTGQFVETTQPRIRNDITALPLGIATGDLDGDSDLDILAGRYQQPATLHLNLLRHIDAPTDPTIGSVLQIDYYGRYGPQGAPTIALPFAAPAPGTTLVPGVGTIGLELCQTVSLPLLTIPQPGGVLSLSANIPNDPTLRGFELYVQALILQGPSRIGLTNTTRSVIR